MEVGKAEVNVGGFCFNAGVFGFEGGLEKPSAATIMRGLFTGRVSGSLSLSGAIRASHGEETIADDEEPIDAAKQGTRWLCFQNFCALIVESKACNHDRLRSFKDDNSISRPPSFFSFTCTSLGDLNFSRSGCPDCAV
jgi:hypothetical protein